MNHINGYFCAFFNYKPKLSTGHMHYCFIINNEPTKASNSTSILSQIENLNTPIDYEVYKTTAHGATITYVKEYCMEHTDLETCFVACGGDGTINEVASGMAGFKDKHLAVLAYGSGNDFIKYYKGKEFRNLQKIIDGTPHKIDILKVNEDRYSINICNFGFDSVVASAANQLSRKGFRRPYRWGIIKALFCGRFNDILVKADGELLNGGRKMLLCTLGNNSYVGGEFHCSPYAQNDDGLIEVGYCKTISLLTFARMIGSYTNGTHLDNPSYAKHFIYRRAKSIEIHSAKPLELCLDGEMLTGQDFKVEVVPSAISFIIPS